MEGHGVIIKEQKMYCICVYLKRHAVKRAQLVADKVLRSLSSVKAAFIQEK